LLSSLWPHGFLPFSNFDILFCLSTYPTQALLLWHLSQIAVRSRPSPTFEIGALDSSVALTLCDGAHPEFPIVYCTESFTNLTGYHSSEIIGSNCRFLQHPPSCFPSPSKATLESNSVSKERLKAKMKNGEEVQVQLINFRKDGRSFTNLLTVVPIQLVDSDGKLGRYMVGLQADAGKVYRWVNDEDFVITTASADLWATTL
jgi:PAS domain-containing protein